MKPAEIFTIREYDMVVAVTFDAINRGLRKIADDPKNSEVRTMILEMTFNNAGKRIAKIHHSFDTVTKDTNGKPVNVALNGMAYPTLTPSKVSGREVSLGVTFTSGTAYLRDLFSGNMGEPMDLTGWSWNFPVDVGFAQIANEINESNQSKEIKKVIPETVLRNLDRFTSDGFRVSSIFCDLQDVNIFGTTSEVLTPGNTRDDFTQQFNGTMTYWLDEVKAHRTVNPYLLGFVRDYSKNPDMDANVPPSLKPIGNTFNVYVDPTSQPRSTLNFIMNTKSSPRPPGPHESPDTFDTSWLLPSDICDGKMAFSSKSLIETLIIKPYYELYSSTIRQQLADGGLEIGEFNPYEQAKSASATGYHFDVYNKLDGSLNQASTYFDVSYSNTSQGVSVDISGFIYWYKKVQKYVSDGLGGSVHVNAWASADTKWKASIPLVLAGNDDGSPRLDIGQPTLTPFDAHSSSGKSDGPSFSIGDLLGKIVTVGGLLAKFVDVDWLLAGLLGLKLLSGLFKEEKLPDAPALSVSLALKAWEKMLGTTIIMPAGQVFFFKEIAVDPGTGVVTLLVDYKDVGA